ncbi:type IV CRISPR-associated protein Csf3 [Burkholderia sp. MBR-1]|uniref:type IV CRISPR-associated protein Csf3 n=1 Tax=Burkholderia sp. MBR-1 TaxID=2732364 RepID=UPI00215DC3EF|nr:type IV CRISPR-associated protein Csf3 [Burkholderia sp. MBR-1]
MVPLRLTWTLETPMVAGAHPLHLDALIAYAIVEEAIRATGTAGAGTGMRDATVRELADSPLPLEREARGDAWCWKASAVVPVGDPGPHSMRFWTRKTDAYDMAHRIEAGQIEGRYRFPLKPYAYKVDTVRGLFKQQFKFFPVRQIEQVQAWCVGDEDRLLDLLAPETGYVTHLGSKGRMGYGRIGTLHIEQDPTAGERWKRRVLPWPHDGAELVQMATRPPYWAIENRVAAYVVPELLT